VLYTCVLWKLFGKYFSALFPLFFRLFCVKHPDGVTGCPDGSPGCLDGVLVVRTILLIFPDVHSSCPNKRVCAISYVALRPDVT